MRRFDAGWNIIHFAPKARDPPEKGRHVYITSMAR